MTEIRPLKQSNNRAKESAIFTSFILIPLGIWLATNFLTHFKNDRFMSILTFFVGIFLISAGWTEIKREFKKIEFGQEGVWVKYPLQKKQFLSWTDFEQICVCYTTFTTRGERTARSVLCFVRPGAKKNMYGRWKADSVIYTGKVISVDYSDELYDEIKKYCTYDIPDLRGTGNYRL